MLYMLYFVFMYIEHVPNRASPPAILLRESYRDGNKIKKRTLANLSALPAEMIECPRRLNFEPPRRLNFEPGWRPA
jgi:hypothetical protein